MSPVVVGVDGSPVSMRALDLAASEAAVREAPQRTVVGHRGSGGFLGLTAGASLPALYAVRHQAERPGGLFTRHG